MALPIGSRHPFIIEEGILAMSRDRELPLNLEIIPKAYDKYSLPLLRNAVICSVDERSLKIVG
jgi:hypothetical protein